MIKVFGILLSKRKLAYFFTDILVISVSAVLSAIIWLGVAEGVSYIQVNLLSFIIMALAFFLLFYIANIYNLAGISHNNEQIITIIITALLSLPVSALFIYMFNLFMIGRKIFIIYGIFTVCGIILTRLLIEYLTDKPGFNIRTAAIGVDNKLVRKLEKMIWDKKIGIELIKIKNLDNLEMQISNLRIEQIIAGENNLTDDLIYSLSALSLKGIRIFDVPEFFEEYFQKIPIDYISNDWLYNELKKKKPFTSYMQNIKQVMDMTIALVLFIASVLFYIPIALAIKFSSKGPVFYIQRRLGKSGKSFYAIKFRSMVHNAENKIGAVWAKEDDERITTVGKFLRKTRLDELPQLINILKGEMSLIGPRPEREEIINYFIDKAPFSLKNISDREYLKKIPFYAIRLLVKPGLTGWAQVNNGYVNSGRGTKEKLEYELYYILNQSVLLDLSILFKTISIVLLRKGI